MKHGPCSGTNKDGSACSGQARPGRAWCSWHDPQLDARRAEWRRRGGVSRSNRARATKALPADLMSMPELQGALCRALRRVESGELEPGRANAMAALARAITSVVEAGEVQDRLAALETVTGLGGKSA